MDFHQLLLCPQCKGQFSDPRLLPCGHTMCLACIRAKLTSSMSVECATCSISVSLPERGVDTLPLNIYVDSLAKMADQLRASDASREKERLSSPESRGGESLSSRQPSNGVADGASSTNSVTEERILPRSHSSTSSRSASATGPLARDGEEEDGGSPTKGPLLRCKVHPSKVPISNQD